MPLVRPVTVAVAVLAFVFTWSNFLDPLIFLFDQEKFTVPLGLRALSTLDRTNFPLLLAGSRRGDPARCRGLPLRPALLPAGVPGRRLARAVTRSRLTPGLGACHGIALHYHYSSGEGNVKRGVLLLLLCALALAGCGGD